MPRGSLAGCILINPDGRILTVHNISSGYWGFPKGHREEEETALEAGLRELKEETGKSLQTELIIGSITARKGCLFVAIGEFEYKCTVDGREIDKYDWITLDELRLRKTSKFTQAFFGKLQNMIDREIKK